MEELLKHYFDERKLIDTGLIAISLIILQAWIAGGTSDPASFISLIAFAASIPMLVFDILILNLPIKYLGRLNYYMHYSMGRILAIIGVNTAIWHVSWIAGIVFLISGFIGFIVYTAINLKSTEALRKEKKPTDQSTTE